MTTAIPFFEAGHIDVPIIDIDLQYFGILVATGVLIGAHLMRKYGDRFAVDDDDMRGMIGWVVATGFIGAHVFDVLAYQQEELKRDPLLIIKLWKGISSYGGFIGGAAGWWFYQWWKRLRTGLWADATVIGLLVAFSIGRIGCTVVSDHVGAPTASFIGMDYPLVEVKGRLCPEPDDKCPDWLEEAYDRKDAVSRLPVVATMHRHAIDARRLDPKKGEPPDPPLLANTVRLHNLGLNEALYLIPVNALILFLAFVRKKRLPAGVIAVTTGLIYAPVRFFFEYLRPDQTDPRYVGMTFAQWASIIAFGASAYFLVWLIRKGEPAPLADEIDPKFMGGRRDNVPRRLNIETKEEKKSEKKKDKKSKK